VADFLWTHCSWTLQNAPRDPDKLRQLLKVKQRQKEEAMDIEDTHKD
jgi:L-lysine 2,3-aminomutase